MSEYGEDIEQNIDYDNNQDVDWDIDYDIDQDIEIWGTVSDNIHSSKQPVIGKPYNHAHLFCGSFSFLNCFLIGCVF